MMNAVCNKVLHPIDGSCCQPLPATSALQKLTAASFLACIVAFLVLHVLCYRRQRKSRPLAPVDVECGEEKKKPSSAAAAVASLNSRGPLLAMCKMGVIMGYFFLCDRADIFMKEQKFYTHSTFFIPLIYIFVLGIFYNENTKEVGRDSINIPCHLFKLWM